jgi:hypothetical protein
MLANPAASAGWPCWCALWLPILDMLSGGLWLLGGYLGYAVKDGWFSMLPGYIEWLC